MIILEPNLRFTQNEGLPLRLSARKNYLDYMIILEPNLRFTQNEGLPQSKICPHPRSLVKLLLCGLKTLKTDFFSDLI